MLPLHTVQVQERLGLVSKEYLASLGAVRSASSAAAIRQATAAQREQQDPYGYEYGSRHALTSSEFAMEVHGETQPLL